MKLFPRLTVGEAHHGDIRNCIDPETWKPYQSPILTSSTAPSAAGSHIERGDAATLHPPRPHHHDGAGHAGSLCLDGQSLRDTSRSKVGHGSAHGHEAGREIRKDLGVGEPRRVRLLP